MSLAGKAIREGLNLERQYRCYLPAYKMQDIERKLAKLELNGLGFRIAAEAPTWIDILGQESNSHLLLNCAFTHVVEAGENRVLVTRQRMWEGNGIHLTQSNAQNIQTFLDLDGNSFTPQADTLRGTRKHSTFGPHGLHQYKGKFYPQLVKSLYNWAGIGPGKVVVDPFSGSGTSLVEASLLGATVRGVDLNPLAVLISNTKVRLLGIDGKELEASCQQLLERLDQNEIVEPSQVIPSAEHLANWFHPHHFAQLAQIMSAIRQEGWDLARDFFRVTLSNILRDCSLQDPSQLRIRRRPDTDVVPLPIPKFHSALLSNLKSMLSFCTANQGFGAAPIGDAYCYEQDVSDPTMLPGFALTRPNQVDAVVTSPPYATALPYLDTDRLSLFLLGMLAPSGLKQLEKRMIGNREISLSERRTLQVHMVETDTFHAFPTELQNLLLTLIDSQRMEGSGFRKQNLPSLLYLYFDKMTRVLSHMAHILKPGAPCVVIVGNSTTKIGDETVLIDTAGILTAIGQNVGLQFEDEVTKSLPSANYASTVHSGNAMKEEKVLLLRKPVVQ